MSGPVVIGNATLYCGDCMDILPTLPKVDAVITDPPYSDKTHNNAKSNAGGAGGAKAIDFKAIDELLTACARLCDGWVVANMDWRHIARLEFEPHAYFELIRFGVWVKSNPMPQISADRPANGWDGIAYLYPHGKKKAWFGGGCHGNWIGPVITNGDHPTGKPVDMVTQWVERFTSQGASVLDPFMGSGTTGVAAMVRRRSFIGIEREPRYFDIACRRIEDAQRQGSLLPPEPVKQSQEALL